MTAYKFLGAGAVGFFTGFAWPRPSGGRPGDWVGVEGELACCANGVHACPPGALVGWIDEELWAVELEDATAAAEDLLVARRGRLRERVAAWDAAAAAELTADCVLRARDAAVEELQRLGLDASPLLEATTLPQLRDAAGETRGADPAARMALDFLADAVALAGGARPDVADPAPGPLPTGPAAIAANLAYVVAAAVGAIRAQHEPTSFDDAFAVERARQNAWLAARVGLPAA